MILRGACAAACLATAGQANAGRPLTVEDAAVVDRGGVQVEAWMDRSSDSLVGWIVPAFNAGLDTEWQAGFARTRSDGRSQFSGAYVQAKTLWRGLDQDHAWGAASVLGSTRDPLASTHRGYDNPYALGVATFALGPDGALLHANAGWIRHREEDRDAAIWGLAAEGPAFRNVAWVAEAYGENRGRAWLRAGGRWSAIPNHLDIDLSWWVRAHGNSTERFLSLGVTWQSGPL
jgi:hypothetical protein